jgi:PAS domain S-box-containing protein
MKPTETRIFKRLTLPGMPVAWVVLCVSLAATFEAGQYADDEARRSARIRFDFRVDEVRSNIEHRMAAYEQVLRGGVGLFASSPLPISRRQWQEYVAKLELANRYPGIQGMGYSAYFDSRDKAAYERRIRAEGFPDFRVWPEGARDDYNVVTYLEPFDERNRRAFGYDMLSEPVRAAAIRRAMETGKTAVSGKVKLKQENHQDVQAGFLMYLPVYRKGMPLADPAQRRAALQGFVYSPFRSKDLMNGILGSEQPDLDVEIFDGEALSAETLMHDDDSKPRYASENTARYSATVRMVVNGRTWSLLVSSLPDFEESVDSHKPQLVVASGAGLSLLLFAVIWNVMTARARSQALADDAIAVLRDRDIQLHTIVESVVDGIITLDGKGMVCSFNRAAEQIFLYPADEVVGRDVGLLMPEASQWLRAAGPYGSVREVTGRRRDGSIFPVDLSLGEMKVGEGRMFTGIVRDISQRKQSEQALRENEERLHLALEGSKLALWDWNIATGMVYLSEQWSVILGDAPRKTVTTFAFLESLVHPDDIPALRKAVSETLKGVAPHYRAEHRVRARSGEWRTISSVGKVVERDAGGRALRMTGTNADISEQKRAAADLLRFKNVLDNTLDMIFMFDPVSLMFVYLNKGAVESMGYTRDELLRMTPYQIKPLITEDAFREMLAPLLSGARQSLEFETVHRRKDGCDFPVQIFLQLVREPGTHGLFVAIVRDITERHRADHDLRESTERMRAIVETVVDGIITINDHGTIETFNPAAERIFGYRQDEVVGRNVNMLMPAPYHDEHDGYLKNYRDSGVRKIIGIGREVVGRRKNGSDFPIELAVSEMKLGATRMFTGIVRDITERKKVDRMKSEFVSTVSHELRTPLTSILGSLGLVAGGMAGALPPQAKGLVEIAHNNSERLVRLINDILDVEKIESGNMRFDLRSQPLMPLVRHAIEANEAYARQYDVRIELNAGGMEGVSVLADSDRFMQVMSNLLSNAAKFSPARSVINVTVTGAPRTTGVRITVSDQGPGIPAAFHERMFQKFAQADSSDTRKKGGTGLGLSIARAIARRSGGDLTFDSLPGHGASFHFDMMAVGNMAEPARVNDHRPVVLVCEDDPDIARLLCLMLNEGGYDVDIALTASDAKRRLAQRKYDAMTLDIMLPDQDGIALVRELRATDSTRHLPIVVISAKADEARVELNGGAFEIIDWLGKPIEHGALLESIHQAVRRSDGIRPMILHVEDDGDVQKILAAMLHEVAEVIPASNLAGAVALLEKIDFDLIVLDVSLPDGSGLDLLTQLEKTKRPVPVLIFSAHELGRNEMRQVSSALVKSKTSNKQLLDVINGLLRKSAADSGLPL